MKSIYLALVAIILAAPAYTQSAPPTPTLTAGPEFKGLRFDWEPVAGATRYELEYKASRYSPFNQLGADLPASATSFTYRFPLHLFDWTFARYRLAACNATACTRSSEVSVSSLRRFAVGYFKASDSQPGMRFGIDTDITPDGLHFVSASAEAAYVFTRGAGGVWFQRAKLLPMASPFGAGVGTRVAISADGDTVVMGKPQYRHGESDPFGSGEVFVFQLDGGSWTRSRLYSGTRGDFGRWVALDDAGATLAVATGTVDRFVLIYRMVDGTWQPVRQVNSRGFCNDGTLSRDGSTLVQPCVSDGGTPSVRSYVQVHSGPNWTVREEVPLTMATTGPEGYGHSAVAVDDTGDTIAAQVYLPNINGAENQPAQVNVFRRTAGSYAQVAVLKPGAWRDSADQTTFGLALAISGDGGTIAVGDSLDNGLGTGPRAAPLWPGTERTGAVYVWRLRGEWRLANMVKPNYRPPDDRRLFGRTPIALNRSGHTLLLSDVGDASDAQGIGGDWSDDDAPDSGAVWLY
jgi:hypothetical protein